MKTHLFKRRLSDAEPPDKFGLTPVVHFRNRPKQKLCIINEILLTFVSATTQLTCANRFEKDLGQVNTSHSMSCIDDQRATKAFHCKRCVATKSEESTSESEKVDTDVMLIKNEPLRVKVEKESRYP